MAAFEELLARKDLKQPQIEAAIELLIWTMYVDNSLTLQEDAALDSFTQKVKWQSPRRVHWKLDSYLGSAIAKVGKAIDNPAKAKALLYDIKTRLADTLTRKEAVDAVAEMAKADGDLTTGEQDFIKRISELFEIS